MVTRKGSSFSTLQRVRIRVRVRVRVRFVFLDPNSIRGSNSVDGDCDFEWVPPAHSAQALKETNRVRVRVRNRVSFRVRNMVSVRVGVRVRVRASCSTPLFPEGT